MPKRALLTCLLAFLLAWQTVALAAPSKVVAERGTKSKPSRAQTLATGALLAIDDDVSGVY